MADSSQRLTCVGSLVNSLETRDPPHTNKSKVGLARRYRFRTTRRHPYHWPLTERAGVQHQPSQPRLGKGGRIIMVGLYAGTIHSSCFLSCSNCSKIHINVISDYAVQPSIAHAESPISMCPHPQRQADHPRHVLRQFFAFRFVRLSPLLFRDTVAVRLWFAMSHILTPWYLSDVFWVASPFQRWNPATFKPEEVELFPDDGRSLLLSR